MEFNRQCFHVPPFPCFEKNTLHPTATTSSYRSLVSPMALLCKHKKQHVCYKCSAKPLPPNVCPGLQCAMANNCIAHFASWMAFQPPPSPTLPPTNRSHPNHACGHRNTASRHGPHASSTLSYTASSCQNILSRKSCPTAFPKMRPAPQNAPLSTAQSAFTPLQHEVLCTQRNDICPSKQHPPPQVAHLGTTPRSRPCKCLFSSSLSYPLPSWC